MSRLFTNYEGKLRGKYISSHRISFIFLIENLSVIVQRSQVTLIQCMLPQIQQFPHKHEVTCMSPNMINKSFLSQKLTRSQYSNTRVNHKTFRSLPFLWISFSTEYII